MDIATLINPKAWGLDAASAAILIGVGTYVWASLRNTIVQIPSRVVKFFSYSATIGPLSSISVALSDYVLALESDPETKMLVRPRNYIPQSLASSSTVNVRRTISRPESDVVEESGNGDLALGTGSYVFWNPRYGIFHLSINNKESQPSANGGSAAPTNFYDIIRYNSGEQIERTVRFFGGRKAKHKLHQFISDAVTYYRESVADKRNCFVYRGGNWRPTLELKNSARSLDGIFSDNDVAYTLAASVGSFLGAKKLYTDTGIPYHYGVLLYGPPGTGKTTLAQAVANHLSMPLYVFQFKSTMDDNDIIDALRSIAPRSIVLFEDIDCNTNVVNARTTVCTGDDAERERPRTLASLAESETVPTKQGENRYGATLSGLLNSLDGVFAPSDVVYLFTTNDRSALDVGLLRRGRIDDHYHMGYISKECQRRMAEYLGCPQSIVYHLPEKAPPCDVQDLALRYLRQPNK